MSYKMSELCELSQTPKSTILFYVKEGLLPEPVKVKDNVHQYGEDTLLMLNFIKYVQSNFHLSLKEVKALTQQKGFSFKRCYEALFDSLDTFMGSNFAQTLSASEACERLGISQAELDKFIEDGFIFMRGGKLTQKEVEILQIVLETQKSERGREILQTYINLAKQTAKIEAECAREIYAKAKDKNAALKLVFDNILILKPYILNFHTFDAYKKENK